MLWATFQVLRPNPIIETGTNHGLSAAFMWKLSRAAGGSPRIRTFDIAASTLAPRMWQRLGAVDDILFTQGDSGAT